MSDLESRVERLEEEVGIDGIDDDLPNFRGYNMESVVVEQSQLRVYKDVDGDFWFESRLEDGKVPLANKHNTRQIVDALEEAIDE